MEKKTPLSPQSSWVKKAMLEIKSCYEVDVCKRTTSIFHVQKSVVKSSDGSGLSPRPQPAGRTGFLAARSGPQPAFFSPQARTGRIGPKFIIFKLVIFKNVVKIL